jgi:3-oxoacyl-[acyl-carrier-protein] synthase II
MARRVVVTGIGLVTPLGVGVKHVWQRILNGECGISSTLIRKDPLYKAVPSRVAGFVPVGDGPGMLNEEEVVSKYDKQKTMPSTMHGLVAAELALNDAGYTKDVLDKLTDSERERMGVFFAVGVSDFDDFEVFAQTLEDSGFENLSSDFLMRNLTSNGSTHLGFKFGFHASSILLL